MNTIQVLNQVKKVTIDFLYLDLNTCDRCQETETNLDEAIRIFTEVSKCLKYTVVVNKINVNTSELAMVHRFESSPTIRVNGRDILGAVKENACSACSEISGQETSCRVFEYESLGYTEPPTAMILEGILSVLFEKNTNLNTIIKADSYILPKNLETFYESTEKKIEIFDPAMCCSTGVCGPSIDTELMRFATTVNTLKGKGIIIKRHGLSSEPQAFISNQLINNLLQKEGAGILPVTLIEGEIVKTKEYPTNSELSEWLRVELVTKQPKEQGCSCGPKGCC